MKNATWGTKYVHSGMHLGSDCFTDFCFDEVSP